MEYEIYKKELGEIPAFLNKYLELDIMLRLKDISLLCGMEYASNYIYNFKYDISRFDHSLNTALITWYLTYSKKYTLASLFHDASSPAFSHVVDYMNGDFIKQESTENMLDYILLSSDKLKNMLSIDDLDISDILDFKKYSVVDLKRPCLCADRIENTISSYMGWYGNFNINDILKVVRSLTLYTNEFNELEIGFNNIEAANIFDNMNNKINELTHSNEDKYMMILMSNIIKKCINLSLISYEDLYRLTESKLVDIIVDNLSIDYELNDMWYKFTNIKFIDEKQKSKIKERVIKPLINGKRL